MLKLKEGISCLTLYLSSWVFAWDLKGQFKIIKKNNGNDKVYFNSTGN